MTDKYQEGNYRITDPIIQPMFEAFKCGTRFCVSRNDWLHGPTKNNCTFRCRVYDDRLGYLVYVKVTNDERRRLLPILKKLLLEKNK